MVEIVDEAGFDLARQGLADIAARLGVHGVAATCAPQIGDGAESQAFAAIAKDLKVDTIEAGAFGHSRLREWALDGLTRRLAPQPDRCHLAPD